MKERTILHLRNPTGWHSVEEIIATLAEGSSTRDFRPLILSLEQDGQPRSLFLETLQNRNQSATRLPADGIRFFRHLLQYVKEQRVDILHTHTYKSDFWGFLAAKAAGIKVIATVHGWTDINFKLRWMGRGNRVLLRFFDKVVFPSRFQALCLRSLPSARVRIIPNGVDLRKRFLSEPRDETSLLPFFEGGGSPLAIIGRLSPEKGHAVLFRALPRVIQEKPSLKCLVIGEGPLRPDLVRLAETLGISDNVIFMGYQKAIGAILSRVDLVIAPSLQEGCPLSLIEAMACGKMIVASDVPGIREVTEGYEPVFLAPPRESRTLADAILKGLASRRKEEEEGSSPRGMLPDRFSSEKMVEAYLKVYEELLMAPPPSVK